MAGEPLPQAEPTAPQYLSLPADRGVHVEIKPGGGERLGVVMAAPDQRGLVSKAAAVLALNSLRIHSASASTHEGFAIIEFVVSPLFGSPPEAGLLRQAFIGALNSVDVLGTLEKRDADAVSAATARAGEVQIGVPVIRSTAPPRILWLDTASPRQLIIEVRAVDRLGLLALLTRALERAGTDIVWAKVNTFGSTAADVFCVTVPVEEPEQGARAAVEQSLLTVLGGPTVEVLEEPVGD
jgi:[protein-PII] uridylyltransferase